MAGRCSSNPPAKQLIIEPIAGSYLYLEDIINTLQLLPDGTGDPLQTFASDR
jgi:hypothetical protein